VPVVTDAQNGRVTDWQALTERTLAEIDTCDPVYRPTSFWEPGLPRILGDMEAMGLEAFKSWPTAGFWFYPRYGFGLPDDRLEAALEAAGDVSRPVRLRRALDGYLEAERDFDVVRLAWDRHRWPFRVERFGESQVGRPPQRFAVGGRQRGYTKPYLNYLLCLAALSQHVDAPVRSVLEIGGGFGVLGEILLRRDPEARYVDLDIPPLCTVTSYYLRELFGDRVTVYDDGYPDRLAADRSGVLPSWRIDDVEGPFDAFVNSYSFQEMEPHVVEHYVDKVVAKDVELVVSLNSRHGKKKADEHEIGVQEQVTSATVVALFEERGYRLCASYGEPLIRSAGELVVLRKRRPGSSDGAARERVGGRVVGAARRRVGQWIPQRQSRSRAT
jgi:putative sugar O-methyltransferase